MGCSPLLSCEGEYLSRLTSSLYYLVVGQRFQLNNTEWSVRRKTAGARNRARSASKRYQAAWNDQCSLVWTAVGGSVCGGSNAAGPSIWLIQTEQTLVASIYRVRSGGVPAHDRLASGECQTLGPRLEEQILVEGHPSKQGRHISLYQTQFYLQPTSTLLVPQAPLSTGFSRVLIRY